jgi:hypothetical protein
VRPLYPARFVLTGDGHGHGLPWQVRLHAEHVIERRHRGFLPPHQKCDVLGVSIQVADQVVEGNPLDNCIGSHDGAIDERAAKNPKQVMQTQAALALVFL